MSRQDRNRDHPPAADAFQVSVRPERVDVLQAGETRENQLEATVSDRAFLGSHARCFSDLMRAMCFTRSVRSS